MVYCCLVVFSFDAAYCPRVLIDCWSKNFRCKCVSSVWLLRNSRWRKAVKHEFLEELTLIRLKSWVKICLLMVP